jgi:hypothetical protein
MSRRIIEPFCDLFLQVHVQYVVARPVAWRSAAGAGGMLARCVAGRFRLASSHQLVRAQRPFFEVGHPQQILIITQSATSAFRFGSCR